MTDSAKKIFRKGDLLIREGERGECAYLLETGDVEILVRRENRLIQIGTRGPGSIVGEMAMIDDKPRTATVRAIEDCEVMEISREDFSRRLEDADPIVQMTMRMIMTRYRDMIGRSQFLHTLPPPSLSAEDAENNDKLRDVAVSTIKIHSELKNALEKNQLLLYYQPIIDLQNMKIAGFEALMRWKHPDRGMISPGIFIPVAETSGLIIELSRWALGVACEAINDLQAASAAHLVGVNPLFVSVNFSVKDFSDGGFFDQVKNTLRTKATEPVQIHLEITESLLMEAPGASKEALEKCRQHGIQVSIDDFGTGYSSLSYLHSFPIDTLKIDQSFIRGVHSTPSSLALVKSIIGLARNLNMKLIAEGIETEQEAAIIRELGCEECQGYWFSRPLPLAEALKLVQHWVPPVIS